MGNLSEFIGFCIGKETDFAGCYVFAANAGTPLSDIATNGLDIVWLWFDHDPRKDFGVLQEVKATTQAELNYATNLVNDYRKLFGTDLQFTLQSRVQAIKNELEYKVKRPDLCTRADALAGVSPASCPGISLVPTLVHDLASKPPVPKLLAVRTAIAALGWPTGAVIPWSVALSDLESWLLRLACGQR